MRVLLAGSLLVCAAPLFVATALRLGHDPVAAEAKAPLTHRNGGFVGSTNCRTCHPDQHASWRRTFHSTMTQLPSAATVLGRFDGQRVTYAGKEARPLRDGDRFCIEVPTEEGLRQKQVALAVGSRRYQQYSERVDRDGSAVYVRLPILWHVEQQRWLHLNTVFLGPDDANWDACASTWNDNCIFCHNTGPEPRQLNANRPLRSQKDGTYDSEVGELGIACEACHGPGGPHAETQASPFARYAQHLGLADPAGIVHPAKLDQERAVSVCGQCHGARLPQPLGRMQDWLATGPTFRAGDRLLDHVAPITQATPVHGSSDPELFALRFWGDGTPRLSAYEYQGVVASPCYQRGKLTCQSCHSMHAGDPRGQLRPDLPGDALCTQCHEEIGRDVKAHTFHEPAGPGSRCVECHMPRIVYGILETHRSHRIENPDPRRDAASARPHACTLCHVDKTFVWAGDEMRRLWGEQYGAPSQRRDGAPLALPDAVASLLCGDAAQRATYARAFGRPGVVFAPEFAAALRAHLAVTMGDGYPSIRWFAQRSLEALEPQAAPLLGDLLARVDHTAGPEARGKAVFTLLDAIAARSKGRFPAPAPGLLLDPGFRLDLRAAIALTDLQGKNVISIGE